MSVTVCPWLSLLQRFDVKRALTAGYFHILALPAAGLAMATGPVLFITPCPGERAATLAEVLPMLVAAIFT
jgi:hypothetical protein